MMARKRSDGQAFFLNWLLLCLLGGVSPLRGDFQRGDANSDGKVNVTDAVAQLFVILGSAGALPCADAADTNDDGEVTIADVLATLHFLFQGMAIPYPGPPLSGPDPTCDRLDCLDEPSTPAVVLSEVYYHPSISEMQEFLELHNRTPIDLDVGGYRFTQGVDLTLPPGTVIPAGGFLLVAKDPKNSVWRNNTAPRVGPYEGFLADGGERLTLVDGPCLVETLRFQDNTPWPTGADGSGRSIERVDYQTPADDFHSWRTSSAVRGTPGAANSTMGTPTHPVIVDSAIEPESPRSTDKVTVHIALDVPAVKVQRVMLRWEGLTTSLSALESIDMQVVSSGEDWVSLSAALPPRPSQTLVRYNLEVELAGGPTLMLPHAWEAVPFLSYFVFDQEMEAKLPILWLFPARRSGVLGNRSVSGAVIREVDMPLPFVFDGAQIRASRNGHKLTFVKGREYRGDRTLNIILEQGGGGTGLLAPQMEHLGFVVYRDLGVLAPHAAWYRVVDYGSVGTRHTQRLLIQQIGERFLELNGLDPNGDLYKYVYTGNEKHTNLDTGMGTLNQLLAQLQSSSPSIRREAVYNRLNLENVCLNSVVGTLIANWDGFHNNFYLYWDLTPTGRWIVIPWDLDQVFEPACVTMPVNRPLTGQGCNARGDARPVANAYHLQPELDQAYRDALRAHIAPDGRFSLERISAMMDSTEALLLEDLTLQEAYLGASRAARRAQIRTSYATMKTYLARRIDYLRNALR